jgi:hypothetical protein
MLAPLAVVQTQAAYWYGQAADQGDKVSERALETLSMRRLNVKLQQELKKTLGDDLPSYRYPLPIPSPSP